MGQIKREAVNQKLEDIEEGVIKLKCLPRKPPAQDHSWRRSISNEQWKKKGRIMACENGRIKAWDTHPQTMKKTIKLVILAGVVALLLSLSIYNTAESVIVYEKVEVVKEVVKKDPLSYQQRAWLGALTWCESTGNPKAVNQKDTDGTPSYGLLQFKPGTFYGYAKIYGIDASKGYMDPDTQLAIVEQMIIRGGIKWSQQFPACTKKLGKPPVSTPRIDKK